MSNESSKDELFDTKHLGRDLKKRSVQGGAITVTTQALKVCLRLGSTMVLARILSPGDYGIMAMVVAITAFANLFINMGLSAATIQRAEVNHAQVSNLFWINAGLGALLTLLIASLSPAIAWFYKTPELVWVTLALSGNFLINGMAVQHRALLNRQMRFFSLAKIQIGSMIIAIGVAILAAIQGLGYWALVLHHITVPVCTAVGAWIATGWAPGLPRRNVGIRSMVKFGSDIMGFGVINYFARNLDKVLIGRFIGSGALGLYSKAYEMLMMPINNLRDPINRVAMPALSRLQSEPEQYRNYYKKLVSMLAFVSMPLVAFLFVCANQVINLLLGSQWTEASLLFQIFALVAFIQPVASTRGLVLITTGKSRKYLIWGIINTLFTCSSFVIGIPWGAKGVAIAYAISNYLILCPSLYYIFKNTPVNISDFIHSIYKPLFASIIMALLCYILINNLQSYQHIVSLSICLVFSAVIYLIATVIISGSFKDIQEYIEYGRLVFGKS